MLAQTLSALANSNAMRAKLSTIFKNQKNFPAKNHSMLYTADAFSRIFLNSVSEC